MEAMVERCAELGTPSAGCVDPNTWAHVRWEKACLAAGIEPLFGCTFPVLNEETGQSPQAWALAEDPSALYAFVSAQDYSPAAWEEATGLVRFAGSALTDPACFDYIDLNPASALATQSALKLAKRTKKPIVLTSDAWYPAPEDREAFLALTDNRALHPQHVLDATELATGAIPGLSKRQAYQALRNTKELGARLAGTRLPRAPMIHFEGNLAAEVEAGRQYRIEKGHLAWSDAYQARLEREMALIQEKDYESYFLVVGDLVRWAKTKMLVGPGRGSSAGSLVCYLLRITEVDPLVHGLLFERFIDLNRADLPDIDIDFSDQRRDLVFDYLAETYGKDCVARLGNVSTLKPRSVLAECGKRLGIPFHETFGVRNVLLEYSSGDSRYGAALEDTMATTGPGQAFAEKFPEADVMYSAEGHAWHTSVHAAGVIVSNEPITNFCSVIGGVCQVDKVSAEALNLLKIDALGLRTLGVIEDAGCVEAETLYGLTLDDPEVLKLFNQQRFAGVFQFEGGAQRRVAKQVPVRSFEQVDHITALARPGPLGGGAAGTYILRNDGKEPVEYKHPSMEKYLGETQGVVLYQEQVMRVVRELGGFSWENTSTIRKAMSGRKGVEFFNQQRILFVKGAAERGIGEEDATAIWEEICSFGAWGMNKAHTVSYSIISYWCAYMKTHHPLEYAAALLRNAKDDEQSLEMLRELAAEGIGYKPFDARLSQADWSVIDGTLIGGLTNAHGIGPAKAAGLLERRHAGKLTAKDEKLLASAKVKFTDLSPAHTMWHALYSAPAKFNVRGLVKQFSELEDFEKACVVCMLVRKERRDENETLRLARRGRRYDGQSLFLDAFVVDDSVTKPVIMRIRPRDWYRWGEKIADRARDGEEWFLVRGKWLAQFSMFPAEQIFCLTNPEIFDAPAGTKALRQYAAEQAARFVGDAR